MAIDMNMKRNDLQPPYRVTMTDGNGSPLNLEDVDSVQFFMRLESDDPNAPVPDNTIDGADCTIEDVTNGVVRYDWVSGDTATSGVYRGEFQMNKLNGDPETVPNNGYQVISILDDLG